MSDEKKSMKRRRSYRVADKVHEVIASHLLHLSDPRLHLVTITSVSVSPDMRVAKVYWVVTGDLTRIREAEEAFLTAASTLRAVVARDLRSKVSPELRFFYDDTLDQQNRVEELLRNVNKG